MTEAIDDIVAAVARDLVVRTAPQELPVFRATSVAYLDDPQRVLRATTARDDMLGFGLQDAVVFVTPVALEVAKTVISFLVSQVRSAVEHEASDAVAKRVRDLFHSAHGGEPEPADSGRSPRLSDGQLKRVHDLALEKARALALPEPQAELLADAVVGGLAEP